VKISKMEMSKDTHLERAKSQCIKSALAQGRKFYVFMRGTCYAVAPQLPEGATEVYSFHSLLA
jgi:hypothetical protein